jgi:Uma2 family endonuclease
MAVTFACGKTGMAIKAEKKQGLTIEAFRAFYQGRPDEERWELIDGVPVMMAPPTFVHQRIASNLERLLNDALERRHPGRAAYQRGGLNLKRAIANYDPEPDVVVVDVVLAPDQHYVDRFYLAAEVVSDSDRKALAGKREIYKLHQHCSCVLTVRQDRCHVRIDARTETGWQVKLLAKPADVFALPDFGLRCAVGDLYKGTPLQPRSTARKRG